MGSFFKGSENKKTAPVSRVLLDFELDCIRDVQFKVQGLQSEYIHHFCLLPIILEIGTVLCLNTSQNTLLQMEETMGTFTRVSQAG
mgnify:CR=1 FL=1